MFDSYINKPNNTIDDTEQIDDQFYAKVMDELDVAYKEKALVGKAIAQSDGNEAKFNSIYVKLRAKSLQDEAIKQIAQERIRKEKEEKQKAEMLMEKILNEEMLMEELKKKRNQEPSKNKYEYDIDNFLGQHNGGKIRKHAIIKRKFKNGYYHKLFRDAIEKLGSDIVWYGIWGIKIDGTMYYTYLDIDNKDFVMGNKNGKVIHSFHIV